MIDGALKSFQVSHFRLVVKGALKSFQVSHFRPGVHSRRRGVFTACPAEKSRVNIRAVELLEARAQHRMANRLAGRKSQDDRIFTEPCRRLTSLRNASLRRRRLRVLMLTFVRQNDHKCRMTVAFLEPGSECHACGVQTSAKPRSICRLHCVRLIPHENCFARGSPGRNALRLIAFCTIGSQTFL